MASFDKKIHILLMVTWNIHQYRITFWAIRHNFNKFKIIEVIQGLLSEYNRIKLEINNIKVIGKSQIIWKLENILMRNMSEKGNPKRIFILN